MTAVLSVQRLLSAEWINPGIVTPLVVSCGFAVLARLVRGVTYSGAIAGALICFSLYASAGVGSFLMLVALFALTWLATRIGYLHKKRLGAAENQDGRSASQVLANLSTAAICMIAFRATGKASLLLAGVAALAEAAADTVASEIGQSQADTARLITSWEIVPAGTDGGITAWGTLSGMFAAFAIVSLGAAVGLIPWQKAALPLIAAIIGMLTDSILGAALERRGWLNNDLVNLLSTWVAAGLVFLCA